MGIAPNIPAIVSSLKYGKTGTHPMAQIGALARDLPPVPYRIGGRLVRCCARDLTSSPLWLPLSTMSCSRCRSNVQTMLSPSLYGRQLQMPFGLLSPPNRTVGGVFCFNATQSSYHDCLSILTVDFPCFDPSDRLQRLWTTSTGSGVLLVHCH